MKDLSKLSRRNLALKVEEQWRPPIFLKPTFGIVSRAKGCLRRFFDLQAATIWNDLKVELKGAKGSVLDVGCGAQPYRGLFAPDVHYVGIDTSEAKDRFGYEIPDTYYFEGSVWPIQNSSMDFILCSEVLEHILVPSQFLSEMFRCLKPGGRVLVTVPFAARWHFVPYDYWRFTPSGIKYLFEGAGLTDVVVQARGNPLTVACYKMMTLFLSLLLARSQNFIKKTGAQVLGVLSLPLIFIFACLANLTVRMDWGDDCLGYTIIAQKSKK